MGAIWWLFALICGYFYFYSKKKLDKLYLKSYEYTHWYKKWEAEKELTNLQDQLAQIQSSINSLEKEISQEKEINSKLNNWIQ